MAELGIPFQLTEVDGVPCFWADAPGPCSAGLLFRVGRADEQLAGGGITALVERLALVGLGPQRYDYSTEVTATTTAFYATGEPDEVLAFLDYVCRSLHALPADRLASERRVLGIEAAREEARAAERLLMMRFGATGFGLPFYEQFGLRWLGHEHAAAWARERFTSGNAALWMTAPPPAGLRLPLPPGPRMPPPPTAPMPGLELPAFAATGTGAVASAFVADRSAAIAIAGRVAADRARASLGVERGLECEVAAWQMPLGGRIAHRQLVVDCADEQARDVLDAVIGIYDAIASDGPTADELREAAGSQLRALADDDAIPGGLDRMAVDELLGAPRLWKEDLAGQAEAASYAEVAAALRQALTTQIVLAPASTPKPEGRPFADFPWFSRERVEGMELRPARAQRRRGEPAARLVVSQAGVSHVGDGTQQASTVAFADVAAALQEPDGALTLIGRDGAIVPLDPAYFKGAGQIVADLERRLPPQIVVPPRDSMSRLGAGVEQVARRKLGQPRWVGQREFDLLRERLDPEEDVLTLCEAVVGLKAGLLALTDRRVIWLHQGPTAPVVRELPYGDVLGVKQSRFPSVMVTLRSPVGETAFSQIHPPERASEVADEVERRAAAATPPPGPPPQ
jgi:hypothetical protein